MTVKGTYKLSYLLDKEPKDLIVVVELKQAEGFHIPRRNIWYGEVVVTDSDYTEDLSTCVDALNACERIGNELKEKILTDAKAAGLKIKIKKELLK